MVSKLARVSLIALVVLLAGCQRKPGSVDNAPPPVAVTTLSPAPPANFNGTLTVTLTTDRPATVYLTTDGTDPATSPTARSGASPLTVDLTRTTTLTFFSRTPENGVETTQNAKYVRAGGVAGTISGVVVVGTVAVGHDLVINVDGQDLKLDKPTKEGEVPFAVNGLATGQHRLQAISDRNDDGLFLAFLDYASDVTAVSLDLTDPFKASAEGVKIYLGASADGLCTIKGTVTFPAPPLGQNLSVAALGGNLLGGGGAGNPTALLGALQNGYRVFTNNTDKAYPYAITNLNPGRYTPVPVLTGFGSGGLAMNFIANPFKSLNLAPGDVGTADFTFGPVAISGMVTFTPKTPPAQPFVYGIVAARNISLTSGVQAVLMPTVFVPTASPGEFQGNYAGEALRDNVNFALRVFTNADSATANPLTDALAWVVNPFAAQQPQATVPTGNGPTVKQDLQIP